MLFCFSETQRSSNASRILKVVIHKAIIRLVVLYGAETWTLTRRDEENNIFIDNSKIRDCSRPRSVFKPRPGRHVSGLRTGLFGFESGSGQ
jgi:hypothetical protein